MAVLLYPAKYPRPLIEGYQITTDMGVRRTEMNSGFAKQRRLYRTMPLYFNFTFTVKISDLHDWQIWVDDNAYDWFEMDATSHLSGYEGDNCSPHVIRFMSDLTITPIDHNFVNVNVKAEMSHEFKYEIPVPKTNDWIVARTPGNPATPDLYFAGTPVAPSVNDIQAGTPPFPAAVV